MIQLVAERSKTSQFKNSNGIEFLDSISGYDLYVDHCLLNFFLLKILHARLEQYLHRHIARFSPQLIFDQRYEKLTIDPTIR